jgi:hypothetical protein
MHDDFFVIWRDGDGGVQRGWLRRLVLLLAVAAVVLAAALVLLQGTVVDDARFEFGTTRAYTGVLVGDPVPLLVTADRTFFLVNPFKYEFDPEVQRRLDGRSIRLMATLIERGERAMLEVVEGTVEEAASVTAELPVRMAIGEAQIAGEIVDSKCYLGVMNPGHLKPHRACAINCLRGGIPPVLLSRDATGAAVQTVLVSGDGQLLRDWILDFVAEPVVVRGEIEQLGDLRLMTVTPGAITRRGR